MPQEWVISGGNGRGIHDIENEIDGRASLDIFLHAISKSDSVVSSDNFKWGFHPGRWKYSGNIPSGCPPCQGFHLWEGILVLACMSCPMLSYRCRKKTLQPPPDSRKVGPLPWVTKQFQWIRKFIRIPEPFSWNLIPGWILYSETEVVVWHDNGRNCHPLVHHTKVNWIPDIPNQ